MTRSLVCLVFVAGVLVGTTSTPAPAQDLEHRPTEIVKRWSFRCDGKPYVIDLREAPPKGVTIISWINNGVPISREDRRRLENEFDKLVFVDGITLGCPDAKGAYLIGATAISGSGPSLHQALEVTFENGRLTQIKR
jgi:hypothetical protein